MARRRRSNTGIPGLSFSWKRAAGVTSMKRKIARATGIPTTRSGRQRKVGRILTGSGCVLVILPALMAIALAVILIALTL